MLVLLSSCLRGLLCPLLLLLILVDQRIFANEPVLLFPQSTVFQFTIGVSVPIAMSKKGGIVFSHGFQFNYVLPWNLSQFQPSLLRQAPRALQFQRLNLNNIYTSLEDLLEKYGWRNGRACLLRTICELAETPVVRADRDIVTEMIHLLLTPSEDSRDANDCTADESSDIKPYEEAEHLGRGSSGIECGLAYSDCVASPLDLFTEILFPR